MKGQDPTDAAACAIALVVGGLILWCMPKLILIIILLGFVLVGIGSISD